MARLWGREWTRRELLERVGDLAQIAGVESFTYSDGVRDGVRGVRVRSGGGLDFTVLPSRGMDIGAASFDGTPIAWVSQTGIGHPHALQHEGLGWLRTFHGGLLTGCGLQNAGGPNIDGETPLGLHGYLSHTPAEEVAAQTRWHGDEAEIFVEGTVREAVMFGENLRLTRRISTTLGGSTIEIHDRVVNVGFKTVPLMMLYHLNFGWPLVSEHTEIVADCGAPIEPRDAVAASGLATAPSLSAPAQGYDEQCFFYDVIPAASGWASVSMVNHAIGLTATIRYDTTTLTQLTQWKMMGQGEYVCGIEPGNCRVFGRAGERAAGRLQTIAPGEDQVFRVAIEVSGPNA